MKKLFNFRLLVLIGVLIMSVSQMWAAADTNLTDGSILYCNVDNSTWRNDNAVMKFNFQFNDNGWDSRKGTNISGTNIWYCKVPKNVKLVQMLRCNPSGWAQWNYSNSVNVSARSTNSQNLVTISGTNGDGAAIAWGSYTPTTITIHVHVPEGWSSPKLYTWFADPDGNNQTTNGDWPGTNGSGKNGQSISNTSGNWYDVTIAKINPNFIIAKDGDTKTSDLTYSGVSNGEYYIAAASSALTAVVKPTVTSSAASSVTYSSAVFNGNVTAMGNDPDISSYGFYWSSSSFTTADVSGCTKVDLGSKTSTGAFTHTATGLSAETTYYFVSYATNHKETSYGTVRNFTTEEAPVVPTLTLDAVSPSSMVSGNDVTITTTRSNTTNAITFEYTTNNGSTWSSLTPKSTSNSGQTAVWTIPEAHGTTQTYKFRAKIVDDALTTSASSAVTVYGKKTIKVKNTNGWATVNLYVYDHNGSTTTAKREEWPGSTTGVTSAGGQWKQVVLTSQYKYFILNDGSSNQISGETYTYASSVSDGSSYAIGSGTGTSLSFSSATAPSAPTSITTSAASSLTNTTATINGNIGGNGNDNITDYGFYWGTSSTPGTKQAKGSSNYTGAISHGLTGLTAGTTYYYQAYATNGQGTTKSSPVASFIAPYKVTVSTNTGCASITKQGVNYTSSTIEVTATKATGYTFSSWSTTKGTQTSTSSTTTTNTLTFTPSADNATIRPTYTENMTTVKITANNKSAGSVTVGGAAFAWDGTTTAGVATTRALVVTAAPGYYFSGWTRSADPDFQLNGYGEANTSVTLTGDGAGATSGQILTANFTELDKIYFRNENGATGTALWDSVYVGFDPADWDEGTSCDGGSCGTNTKDKTVSAMSKLPETNVWWAYVPRTYTVDNKAGTKKGIVFFDKGVMRNYDHFYGNNAALRGDYSYLLNMFVPHHTSSGTANKTVYHSNGYWMKYDTRAGQGSGYYLKKYNSRNSYSLDSVFRATNDDATFIQCRIRVDGTTDANNRYMIVSAAGLNYIADSTITSLRNTKGVSEDTRTLADNDVYFQVKATSEGFYTFILDQSGDKMKLTVDYPVSPGDYRLKHTYAGRNKANSADSTYITYSDIIKASDAASGTTVSMYLSTAGTETLVLQECTSINGSTKLPEWNAGYSDGLSGVFTKVGTDGDGVYQFDVTVNTSTHKVTATENIALYDGPFYIKTDCAPGGWANYKQNILKENTVNASDYDYYMCKWIGNTTTNVKCVIANDYNNEISDTLKSDAILTRSEIEYQTLPEAGSVRFSYNSATNELKRTYLLGGTTQVKIEPLDDYVYGSSSGSDEYTTSTNFTDCGNWMYRLEAYVYPGAKAGVYTNYPTSNPTKEQLVPTTFTLMGGESKGSTRYNVQLIYDFQTNELVSAYIANGNVSSAIDLNSNFLYVRNGVGASTQLSFSDGGKLTNVKHAYGVFEFPKDSMSGQMPGWTDNYYRAYKRCRYYFSFPFDVRVSDIFGVGEYGTHYIIQKYNGAKRAKVGWFMEYNTFWETVSITDTLNANEGYCLMLDRKAFNSTASDGVWTNIGAGQSTYLYFPSMYGSLGTIDAASGTYDIDSLSCKIDRSWTTEKGTKNHKDTDSNWRMIGMPAYANAYSDGGTNPFTSCYKYYPSDNSWKTYAVGSKAAPLQSMHAYMVQWAGKFDWTTTAPPAGVAARQPQNTTNTLITLNLLYEGTARDWTYVKLQEGAESDFVLNEDLCKIVNGGIPNIYTYAGSYDAGYNEVPVANQTIPVGVIIRNDGEYTFSMPENVAATVTLIDSYTGTRTNLSISDYSVELENGAINDRFYLEINMDKVATAIDGAMGEGEGTLKDGKAHKFIENGVMYILRDGQIYSTDGQMVK